MPHFPPAEGMSSRMRAQLRASETTTPLENTSNKSCEALSYLICCSLYCIPTLPLNIAWTTTGWIFCLYDYPRKVLPENLTFFESAVCPCEHAAIKNERSCGVSPSLYLLCAPFQWMRMGCDELIGDQESSSTYTHPNLPYMPSQNPLGSAPAAEEPNTPDFSTLEEPSAFPNP